jgi:hypothetical protein
VHEDVAEPGHRGERARQVLGQPSVARQQCEELAVAPRLAETSIGRHVRGNIQGSLDGDLQRVLPEALLALLLEAVGQVRAETVERGGGDALQQHRDVHVAGVVRRAAGDTAEQVGRGNAFRIGSEVLLEASRRLPFSRHAHTIL